MRVKLLDDDRDGLRVCDLKYGQVFRLKDAAHSAAYLLMKTDAGCFYLSCGLRFTPQDGARVVVVSGAFVEGTP